MGPVIEDAAQGVAKRDAFEDPAPPQGNDRLATRQSLHRREAEILLTRHEQSPAPGLEITECAIRHAPGELDVARGQ